MEEKRIIELNKRDLPEVQVSEAASSEGDYDIKKPTQPLA